MFPPQSFATEPRIVLASSAPEFDRKDPVLRTPNDFFQFKYPSLTKRFGPAFIELHWLDSMGLLNVECQDINIDLFAGITGGTSADTRTIFYAPEHQFYAFDRVACHFKIISEETLKFGLSQELIQCASYMGEHRSKVGIARIFRDFRHENVLNSVVKRAKGLLAVDETFFEEGRGNRRSPKLLTGEETARIFVQEALRQEPGKILKLGDAYEFYAEFCNGRSLPIVRKNGFKQPTILAVRDTFNLGFRNDLKLDGKYAHGWKGLEVVAGASQPALAE